MYWSGENGPEALGTHLCDPLGRRFRIPSLIAGGDLMEPK